MKHCRILRQTIHSVCLSLLFVGGLLNLAAASLPAPEEAPPATLRIIDRPISWSPWRERLAQRYALEHYGDERTSFLPQAIVVHWTEDSHLERVFDFFNREATEDMELQVSAQFLVDRDGTVYRLTPATKLNRHTIGYNWCAIGIENIGGEGRREDLTLAQLSANASLIHSLHRQYPSIRFVFGHYQQDLARASGLYREKESAYRSEKVDPGPRFMAALHEALKDEGVIFFQKPDGTF